MKIKQITEENKLKFLEAFINDHFHDHKNISEEFYKVLGSFQEFVYSGECFRAVITIREAYNFNYNFNLYKSWSKSKDGVKRFIDNEIIDGRYKDGDLVYLLTGNVIGIDINKIILFLKTNGIRNDHEFSSMLREEEIVAIETSSGIKEKIFRIEQFFE